MRATPPMPARFSEPNAGALPGPGTPARALARTSACEAAHWRWASAGARLPGSDARRQRLGANAGGPRLRREPARVSASSFSRGPPVRSRGPPA